MQPMAKSPMECVTKQMATRTGGSSQILKFQNLLNAGNKTAEGGNLVFEIVCRYPVKQADAVAACKGYKSQITIPDVGSRVRIVGSHVQDTFHAQWMEIHPVTSITVIP